MEIVLLVSRLFLALMFGIAGTAKASDLAGTRRALVGFAVPEKLAAPLGYCLPLVEILVAVLLLPEKTAWTASIGALALLSIFAVAIAVNLGRGRAPDCNCFGGIHSKPVTWSVFTRNLLLAGVAAFVVAQGAQRPGPSALTWLMNLKTAEAVSLSISLIVMGLLISAVAFLRRVLNQQTTLLERIEAMKRVVDEDYAEPAPLVREDAALADGFPVGAPAPFFSLAAIGGSSVSLDDLLESGKEVLLIFVSPNCAPCKTLLPLVSTWERDYADRFTLALLSKGTSQEIQSGIAKYGATHLLLQGEGTVADDYQAKWTPAAVFVSPYGKIASRIAYGDEAIRALVTASVASGTRLGVASGATPDEPAPEIAEGSSLRVGDPAPHFSISDLQGDTVATLDFFGRDTLLLFWDPACPFCQAMAEDLKKWEMNPPKTAPRLVFVASGDPDQIDAESKNFKSLFLHDREFEVPRLFGTSATPSAVMIDRDGHIASAVAIGLPSALALAGVRKVEPQTASRF
jgi:peroxiredoxin/uncharacterized membrane protein YphA (DoxX/SURF4 family)